MSDAVRRRDESELASLDPPRCADCIVLTHDGKILLQQRPENWGASAGRLTSFGGHIEGGETPLEGMRRELEEETGAKIGAEEAVLVGIVTEDITQHKEPLYIYFWHDQGATITGCYECEAVYYDRIAGALAHPKIMPYLRWALLECQQRGLLP